MLPLSVFSGEYNEGHVQGIAVDKDNGYVYFAFTTMLLKTDFCGNPIGSVKNFAGHLGCITFDKDKNRVYGSLELKHDIIGADIMKCTGKALSDEDAFYLVSFDCEKIDKMNMDAETDNVMKAIYLPDVVNDYNGTDPVSGKKHVYGCSGIDGTALGPVFGKSEKKIMIAYGIYSETDRKDNDYQVILQFDRSVIDTYGAPLNQLAPHHSGVTAEEKYFFFTGNTNFGVQNLEYDEFTKRWIVAVYRGNKPEFKNYRMFFIDGTVPPQKAVLKGRGDEKGLILTPASSDGTMFPYGQTGIAAIGDGTYYFSHDLRNPENKLFASSIHKYRYLESDPYFIKEE